MQDLTFECVYMYICICKARFLRGGNKLRKSPLTWLAYNLALLVVYANIYNVFGYF